MIQFNANKVRSRNWNMLVSLLNMILADVKKSDTDLFLSKTNLYSKTFCVLKSLANLHLVDLESMKLTLKCIVDIWDQCNLHFSNVQNQEINDGDLKDDGLKELINRILQYLHAVLRSKKTRPVVVKVCKKISEIQIVISDKFLYTKLLLS